MMDAARRFYTERHGEDRWFEEVETAYYEAIAARAERERARRVAVPDYARINPVGDLQGIVQEAVRAAK
jgi:hypothetical protein